MKKNLFIIPILLIGLLFASCKGDTGLMGPQGPQGVPGVGYFETGYIEIKSSNWVTNGTSGVDGAHYSYTASIPELNNTVFEEGSVNAYLELDNRKYSLQQTFSIKEGDGYTYSESYKYNYEPGKITFIIEYSDFILRRPAGDLLFYFTLESLN